MEEIYRDMTSEELRDAIEMGESCFDNIRLQPYSDLSWINIEKIKRSLSFKNAHLIETIWDGAILGDGYKSPCYIDFRNANLKNAKFQGAHLYGVNFHSAILNSVNFKDAKIGWADLTNASLHFADIKGANFKKSRLDSCDLSFVSGINDAEFCGAHFNDAIIDFLVYFA